MEQNVIYAFGQYRLQMDTQLLCNESEAIRLQPKIYRLLLYFVQHTGRLISKKELFNEVWQGRIVEDTALRLAVNSLRKALRDEIKSPRYISTACKYGYRFLPDVKVETDFIKQAASRETANISKKSDDAFHDAATEFNANLNQFLEAFYDASSGKRNLIFLNGQQGVGKTALIERFLNTIENAEFGFLRARCVPLGCVVEPFLPILEALERRCQADYGKVLIECLQKLAPSWLYQMLNVLHSGTSADLETKLSNLTTGRMLREGTDFFELLAKQTPFILILDNGHWSDEYTLDLLSFLAFRCSSAKLLIVLSYRPDTGNASARRIELIQKELNERGLCREIVLNNTNLLSYDP